MKHTINRRNFCKSIASLSVLGALSFKPSILRANTEKRLAIMLITDGLDIMSLFPPFGVYGYELTRGKLALPHILEPNGPIALSETLGLHPWASSILPIWQYGNILFSPNIGISHSKVFDKKIGHLQVLLDKPDSNTSWLETIANNFNYRHGHIGDAVTAPIASTDSLNIFNNHEYNDAGYRRLIELLYANDQTLSAFGSASAIDRQKRNVMNRRNPAPKLSPNIFAMPEAMTILAKSMMSTDARLAVVEASGFDVYAKDNHKNGATARSIAALAGSISNFRNNISDDVWDDTLLCVVSPWGRSVIPNRRGGTDIAGAGSAIFIGGNVGGSWQLSEYPYLHREELLPNAGMIPNLAWPQLVNSIISGHFNIAKSNITAIYENGQGFAKNMNLFK